MAEPAFTRGPWTLTHRGGNNFAIQCFEIRGVFGDKPNVSPIFNRDTSSIHGTVIYTSPQDARLIAAATCMYEALARLAEVADACDPHCEDSPGDVQARVNEAYAILAKARGDLANDVLGEMPK